MKKTLLSLSLLSALSFNTLAFRPTDCYSSPELCETITIVDFNENPTIQDSSMQLLDWNELLQDTYTSSVGNGSTIKIGDNGEYNYQGVRGFTPNEFLHGEYLLFTYENTSNETVTFRPQISFDDADRIIVGSNSVGFWTELAELTLAPNEIRTIQYYFNQDNGNTGSYSLINTNLNNTGQKHIAINKIEYLSKLDKSKPITNCTADTCRSLTVLDFSKNTVQGIQDSSQITGFDKFSYYELYQRQHISGTGITLKEGAAGYALWAASINENGTHTFKAGEQIVIEVSNHSSMPENVSAYISFDDYNSKPWGDASTWHLVGESFISNNFMDYKFVFTFTEETAGTYDVINVTLPNEQNGDITLNKVTYLTNQDFKADF